MDRFFRGVVAGIAGGIVMNIWSFFSYHILHFTKMRFLDWAGILLYGHLPEGLGETVYATFIQIIWAGFMAVFFTFLIPAIFSKGYIIKAIFFSYISGFIIYAIPTLYKVPNLMETTLNTTISNHTGKIL
ncbi:MAG: hypothetical protein CVU87_08935 [Firmicutes bacterium HGW-Firmicutes-12]|jgi:hypothetical protein|nr:MAG: hypothetical protein CVU87_08935 [Firmicutes bacterium HGW-Firmicutes-12]